MARIVGHLPAVELEARYRAARDATEARHFQAVWLLAQGRTTLEVAGVLAFTPRWVDEVAARYNAHGPDALGDRRRRNGRAASVLTAAVLAALSERLRAPPEDGGCWTGEGRAVDGRPAWGGAGASAARLGSVEAGALVHPGPAPASPALGHA